jgi:copper oxidase (laccase) domain-containing protein
MTKHGVQTVFSHRDGGFSEQPFDSLNLGLELGDDDEKVAENLNLLLEKTDFPTPHQIKQVHGIQIKTCGGAGSIHS